MSPTNECLRKEKFLSSSPKKRCVEATGREERTYEAQTFQTHLKVTNQLAKNCGSAEDLPGRSVRIFSQQKRISSLNTITKTIPEIHQTVLLAETVELLDSERGGTFVDATLGLGGHTEFLLEKSSAVRVIGIDQDLQALEFAKQRLERFGDRFEAVHSNFAGIGDALARLGVESVAGIMADLGVSSLQLDSEERGFSFRFDAPLDMRMNPESGDETAAELLEALSEFDIAKIIYEFGEERLSRRIARRIVEKREQGNPIATTKELADLVSRCVPRGKKDKIHPATRTFQALRIAVNRELEVLESFIKTAVEILEPEGRLAIISFHSLEDRIVKQAMQKLAGKCQCPVNFPACFCGAEKIIEIITRKPVVPEDSETNENPRARSAKLRACKKLK
jgi:16S rRNA (cytosine1402-N4)-methyltransferase